jgi:hypothetical protein
MADKQLAQILKGVKKLISRQNEPLPDLSLEAIVSAQLEIESRSLPLPNELQAFYLSESIQKAKDTNVVKVLGSLHKAVKNELKLMNLKQIMRQLQPHTLANCFVFIQRCGELVASIVQRYKEDYASASGWIHLEDIVCYYQTELMAKLEAADIQIMLDLKAIFRVTLSNREVKSVQTTLADLVRELNTKYYSDIELVHSSLLITANVSRLPACLLKEVQAAITYQCSKQALAAVDRFILPTMKYEMKQYLRDLCSGAREVLLI